MEARGSLSVVEHTNAMNRLRVPPMAQLPKQLQKYRPFVASVVRQLDLPADEPLMMAALSTPDDDTHDSIAAFLEALAELAGPSGLSKDDKEPGGAAQRAITPPQQLAPPPEPQVAMAVDHQPPATIALSTEARDKRRRSLAAQINIYSPQQHFPTWEMCARRAIDQFGEGLPPADIVASLRSRLDTTVAKQLETDAEALVTSNIDVFLNALRRLNRPRDLELAAALESVRQAPGQTATAFVAKLKKLYEAHRCRYPATRAEIGPLVQKIQAPYFAIIQNLYLLADAKGGGDQINIAELESWAETADAQVSKERMSSLRSS